jgi:hypothetical protein
MSKHLLKPIIVSSKNPDLISFRQGYNNVEDSMTDEEKKLHFQQELNSEYAVTYYKGEVIACIRFIDWSLGISYLQKYINFCSYEYESEYRPTIEVSRLLVSKGFRKWDFTTDFLREAARCATARGFEAFFGYAGKLESRLYQSVGAKQVGSSFTVQRGEQLKEFYISYGLLKNCYETYE